MTDTMSDAMTETMTGATSVAPTALVQRLRARITELEERRAYLTREVQRDRQDYAKLIAKGAAHAARARVRTRVRDHEDEADGIARALEMLAEELASAEQSAAAAVAEDASRRADAALAHWREIITELDARIVAFVTDTLGPGAVALTRAVEESRTADRAASRAAGQRNAPPRVIEAAAAFPRVTHFLAVLPQVQTAPEHTHIPSTGTAVERNATAEATSPATQPNTLPRTDDGRSDAPDEEGAVAEET